MPHAQRLARLRTLLEELPDALVAFSGGVDSSVLLHAAHAVHGARAVALIGDSPSLPRSELRAARAVAAHVGARLIELSTDEMERPEYRANDGRRCYFCRHTLFTAMEAWARTNGHATLLYGEIADDLGLERPGRAAAGELRVGAPLAEAGFTKDDVRRYAREHGLSVADKPAAACLASRLSPGTPVTLAGLARIEAAEERLRPLLRGTLRVRDRGAHARIEVDAAERAHAESLEGELRAQLAPLGFATLELATYGAAGIQAPPANTPER